MSFAVITREQLAFLESQPVARLATADADGAPHALPVCFALSGSSLYIGIDEKPKRAGRRPLKRIRNIQENPNVAVIVDHYEDDWNKLGWIMLRGRAEILTDGAEQEDAHELLRRRYAQYRDMYLVPLPVISVRIEKVTSWGNLDLDR